MAAVPGVELYLSYYGPEVHDAIRTGVTVGGVPVTSNSFAQATQALATTGTGANANYATAAVNNNGTIVGGVVLAAQGGPTMIAAGSMNGATFMRVIDRSPFVFFKSMVKNDNIFPDFSSSVTPLTVPIRVDINRCAIACYKMVMESEDLAPFGRYGRNWADVFDVATLWDPRARAVLDRTTLTPAMMTVIANEGYTRPGTSLAIKEELTRMYAHLYQ